MKTSFSNLRQVGYTSTAFRLLPDDFATIDDAFNDSIRAQNNTEHGFTDITHEDMFHYSITNVRGSIDIAYSADVDAEITAILSSSMGVLYRKQCATAKGGDIGNIRMNTAGLPRGQYVIYINVNGHVYSKAINIR